MSLGDAITLAIDECLENGILSDILTEERAEVLATYLELIKDDMISVKEAASRLEISEKKIKELLKK